MSARVISAPGQPWAAIRGLARRRDDKLTERAAGAGDAERHAAALGRDQAADRAEDDGEAGGGGAEPDQQAGAEVKVEDRLGPRHADQAEDVNGGPGGDHPSGAIAVGDHAGHGLEQTPQQVLHGERQGERFAPNAQV